METRDVIEVNSHLEQGEYLGVELILPLILLLGQKAEELLDKLGLGEVMIDDSFLGAHFVDRPSEGRLLRDRSVHVHHTEWGATRRGAITNEGT